MVGLLVVEEHVGDIESVARILRRRGYETSSVSTGGEALKMHQAADLVLLDLDLPDLDGLAVCRSIRAVSEVPVISFTSRDTELDRVLALQAGADDCVIRTCGAHEVMARIEAVMRRAYPVPVIDSREVALDSLHIDSRTREVRLGDRPVSLTSKEFELLYVLASQPETVVSRKELMETIWEDTWIGSSRTIDTHVSSLRGKLGAATWIITVRGVGYRIGRG